MKKIFLIFAIIFSTTAFAKKNDVVIPKYFFANELTKKTQCPRGEIGRHKGLKSLGIHKLHCL